MKVRKGKTIKKYSLRIESPHLYSPRQKIYGCFWKFTLGDPDDIPSVPHAHSLDGKYKLDVWNGKVYNSGNERWKEVGTLKKKELAKLYSDSDFKQFAQKHIEWYRSEYPQIDFYIPDWFKTELSKLKMSVRSNTDETSIFVFGGTVVMY